MGRYGSIFLIFVARARLIKHGGGWLLRQVIFAGHRPSYYVQSSGAIGPDNSDNFCSGSVDIEPLLIKHKVDLALWGK